MIKYNKLKNSDRRGITPEDIEESRKILEFCKLFINNNQKVGSDYSIEFRKGLVKSGVGRSSYYRWFNEKINFKQKNIDRVKKYLTDLGQTIK